MMKFCIISDLHCKYQQDYESSSESFLISNKPRVPYKQHPVAAMIKAIENDPDIKSDFLVCLGDLGDRADEQGITSAWTFLEEIHLKLGSKLKIGIPGNHDINSRKNDGKEPFSYIKEFHESFPTNDAILNDSFWNKGYCILVHENVLFLMINSVVDHTDKDKANKAAISPTALAKIEEDLDHLQENNEIKYRLCILHHHPIKHSDINNYRDSDSLDKGDLLIDILVRFSFNILVHGHKHQPRIREENGLPILASGSFSSFANLQGTGLTTMFHVIELVEDKKVGIVRSWEYNIKDGWSKAQNRHFPSKVGFGHHADLEDIARRIKDSISDQKPKLYSDIKTLIPELDYLIPEKLSLLSNTLKIKYKIIFQPEFPLEPAIITFSN